MTGTKIKKYPDFTYIPQKENVKKIIISECGAEDYAEEKNLADAKISPEFDKKFLSLECFYLSPMENIYGFYFLIPQIEVMSIYKKGRGFPTYLFYYLGYPGPILLDAITSPVQIFIIGCLAI